MSETVKAKELTGRHVLMMLLTFFGVMLAVNIYFTVVAVKSFRGEDVPRSYRQGLEYNKTLSAREIQSSTGWSAHINSVPDKIFLRIVDKDGISIPNIIIDAKLRHPADTAQDKLLEFAEYSGGHFEGRILGLKGRWIVVATAHTDTQTFKFEHELWLE